MTSSLPHNTYADPQYEEAHQATFAPPTAHPIKQVLPPGLNKLEFDEAVRALVDALGKDAVFVDEALAHYIDPYEVYVQDETRRKVPSAAVCPDSMDKLKKVLEIANKYKLPLWTFSRGKNLGYGGPAPRVSGSVALDLHRMDKIIEVNDELCYAVVEPGVTFQDLYEYCVKHRKKVWPSTASIGWGSVIGNTLDRGTGFAANSNHHQCMAGIEVMLADGDVVRTGQFGISNSPSAFISKFTYGPSIEGLFLQSNLGVVTKLSLWLTPQPSAFISCSFSVPEMEDIEPLVDVFAVMRQNGVLPNCVWVSSVVEGLCIRGVREDFWKGPGRIPDWRVKELQKELGLGYWTARFGLYGPRRVVQAHFDEAKDVLRQRVPQGELTGHLFTGKDDGLLDASSVPLEHGNVLACVPSLLSLPLMSWPLRDGKGKPAHGDYAPIIPASGKKVLDWMRVSKSAHEAAGLELMTDFFMHEKHIILTSMYTYDQEDPAQRHNVHQLWYALHNEAKSKGYGMYRGHIQHMDEIASLNDFNDHAYMRLIEKIKNTVDPNGILSPGKQGIWPERYVSFRDADNNGSTKSEK